MELVNGYGLTPKSDHSVFKVRYFFSKKIPMHDRVGISMVTFQSRKGTDTRNFHYVYLVSFVLHVFYNVMYIPYWIPWKTEKFSFPTLLP